MAKLSIMDHTGHSVQEFDRADSASVARAMEKFRELTGAGHVAARMSPAGNQVIRAFDPDAEEILFFPQRQGG